MKLVAGAASDVGQLREKNEDSFLIDDRLLLFAVADGMGGHRGGAVASSTSLEALRAAVGSGDEISSAIQSSNRAVHEASIEDTSLAGMGTTLTAIVAAGGSSLLIGHVGDSRAYLVRADRMRQITDDHSLVEELVREGRLTREQAEIHPQRSIITRALGVDPSVAVDVFTLEVRAGDRLVLCSDGLTTMLRDSEIESLASAQSDPRRAADQLVDAANTAGGEDNVTVVVVDVVETDADDQPLQPDEVADFAAGPEPDQGIESQEQLTTASQAAGSRSPLAVMSPSRPRRARAISLVVLPVVMVVAIAIGSLGWYARRSYYVGIDSGEVVVFQGIPGGVLWWDPTVAERSDLVAGDLTPADLAALDGGAAQGSRQRALDYLERLAARTADATSSSTSTSSTVPPRTTTSTSGSQRSTTTSATSTVDP